MIVSVTPNPSFDRTVSVGALEPGEVHRISAVTTEAGGKGINVARAIARSGAKSRCVFPATATDAIAFAELLADTDHLEQYPVGTGTSIRTNITIVETDGRTTKLNEPGEHFDDERQAQLVEAVVAASADAEWVAICGSLPPGVAPDFANRLGQRLPDSAKLAIDASGEALLSAVTNGCDLIKPNHEELVSVAGRPLPTVGDVLDAASEIQRGGVATVLVSLGSTGALLVTDAEPLFGTAPAATVQNTVGAGDAFLAGFLAGGGFGGEALAEALSWGRAAVASASTAFPPAAEADRAAVMISSEIDRTLQVEG